MTHPLIALIRNVTTASGPRPHWAPGVLPRQRGIPPTGGIPRRRDRVPGRKTVALIGALAPLLWGSAAPSPRAATHPEIAMEGSAVYRELRPDVFMTDWLVCGPFTVEAPTEAPEEPELTKKAFTHDFLTEHGGEAQVEPAPGMTHHLRGKELSWQHVTSPREFVSFVDLYGMRTEAAAYAYAEIEMPTPAHAVLGLGSDDAVKVWLNGELVHSNWAFRLFVADQDQVPLPLRQGRNRLLIKVYNHYSPPWGFGCRLMGPEARTRSFFRAACQWSPEDHSPAVRDLLDRLEGDLTAGPERLAQNWAFGVAGDYSLVSLNTPLPPALRFRLGRVADRLSPLVSELPNASRSGATYLVARFYEAAGRMDQAVARYQRLLRLPGDHSGARYLLADWRWRTGTAKRQGRSKPPVDEWVAANMHWGHIPGLSLGIVKDGKLALGKGYGLANVARSVPATKDTVYLTASLTKTFTATGIMLLVQEGKLSLEDPMSRYLPETPPQWQAIRIRHLITHTSGIPHMVHEIAPVPLLFPPGEKWSYSDGGYDMLGKIIERVTGKPLEVFLHERLWRPYGMNWTAKSFDDLDNMATGYILEGNALRKVNPRERWGPGVYEPYGGGRGYGNFVTTVTDLAKFDAALYPGRLFKPATLEQIRTPATLNNAQGLGGWGVGTIQGYRYMAKDGGTPGVSTEMVRFPEDKLAFIVLIATSGIDTDALLFSGGRIMQYYLPPEPIEDKSPTTTQMLKSALLGLMEGKADPTSFTPEALAALAPELQPAAEFYQSLGPLKTFTLIEQKDEGNNQTLRYRTVFGNEPWIHQFTLTPDGKIKELAIEPE
jgi:CubicO group peptidase (beta-lactamase class C family)